MSKKRRYALLLAVVLMASALSLPGCSSSGNSTADSNQPASVAKGVVTVSATFPGAGGAVKSLIPSATQAIYVKFYQQGSQVTNPSAYDLELTAAKPTGTIKLAPGNYIVNAAAYDSAVKDTSGYPIGKVLSQTSSGGVVQLGDNTVNLTFLNGTWTVVNTTTGTATPLVLSTGLGLKEMVITGGGQPVAAKSAFDFSKPIGGSSGQLQYLFSDATSAITQGSMMSQFIGTQNSITVSTNGPYNLTQKCSSSSYEPQTTTLCEEKQGDQMIMVSGADQSSGSYSDSYYQGDILYGNASALLPNQGQTSFTQGGTAIDLMSKLGTSTVTSGDTITGSLVEIIVTGATKTLVTTASPAKLATAKAVKAQSTNTPYTGITATDYGMRICASTANPNKGTWNFYNQLPETIGTATCYRNGYLMPGTTGGPNAGDFSYGLEPTDTTKLGDYCHQWSYDPTTKNLTCSQKAPPQGEVYMPGNFIAKRIDNTTTINYGSFKLNFHVQKTMSGTIYVYPFTAKGKAN